MMNLFSDEMRRDPYLLYDHLRSISPVLHIPQFHAWLIFDYDGVERAVTDHHLFSSAVPGPKNWFIFDDPPSHTRLRNLISKAFTPKSVANLEPSIRELSNQLLTAKLPSGEIDLASDYSIPLPMMVIAKMLGLSSEDLPRYKRWSDEILKLSYSLFRGEEEAQALQAFRNATEEMKNYLPVLLQPRRSQPQDDLLTRLLQAEVEGEKLSEDEILGFVQLLLVGGQETTTNLVNNAILCFLENPDQLVLLRSRMELLPSAIEEVLRYRSPLQWVMRTPRRDVHIGNQLIPAGHLVLPIIGSANRDPKQFTEPNRFDITRQPNAHLAFGHGPHACLGAPLARMEARIALTDLLTRWKHFELASKEPWQPRKALNVLGPTRLPIRFENL